MHIIRVNAHHFLQVCAHPHKGSARSRDVSFQTSNYGQPKVTTTFSEAGVERLLQGKRRRKAASGVQVAIQ